MSVAEYSRIPNVDPDANDKESLTIAACDQPNPQDGEAAPARTSSVPSAEAVTCRDWVGTVFVKGDRFQSFVALVILANAAIIGLETDFAEDDYLWDKFEYSFLFVFTIEILLRFFYLRLSFFCGSDKVANLFDLSLVSAGVMEFVMTVVCHGSLGHWSLFIKLCRLLRILRLFRLFKMFKQLYMLASGFVDSSVAVFWVSVLCGLCLYVCAIFLTRTLGHFDSSAHMDASFYRDRFGSVATSMFTLFELMANPNLDDMKHVMFAQPAMMFFFITFVVFGSFAMLSILTGVISEGMIEKGNSHKEEMRFQEEKKKQEFLNKLRQHFQESDVDGDGTMTKDEFLKSLPEMMVMFQEQGFEYAAEDLEMVFNLVDFDQGGTVELEEFLQGMTSFTANVADLPLQILRLQSNVFVHMNKMETVLATRMDNVDARFIELDDRVARFDDNLSRLITQMGG